jgi:hypothetical protein
VAGLALITNVVSAMVCSLWSEQISSASDARWRPPVLSNDLCTEDGAGRGAEPPLRMFGMILAGGCNPRVGMRSRTWQSSASSLPGRFTSVANFTSLHIGRAGGGCTPRAAITCCLCALSRRHGAAKCYLEMNLSGTAYVCTRAAKTFASR